MPAAPPPSAQYSERLHISVGWWIGAIAMAIILGLELVPIVPVHGAITMTVPLVLTVLLLASASLTKVEVRDGVVRAGKWTTSCEQIASVEELDQRNTRQYAGASGDPAAVTVVRPWLQRSVRIVCVTDDPPYALVSSRRPEALAAAVIACATKAAEATKG